MIQVHQWKRKNVFLCENTRFFENHGMPWDENAKFRLIFDFLNGMGSHEKSHGLWDPTANGMVWDGIEKAVPCATLVSVFESQL